MNAQLLSCAAESEFWREALSLPFLARDHDTTDPNFVQSMKKERKKKYFGVHHCMKTSKTFCEAEADVFRA